MSALAAHVITVRNKGRVETEIHCGKGQGYYDTFTNLYRNGYKNDVYTLYSVEDGKRTFVESYNYNGLIEELAILRSEEAVTV